MRMKTLAGFAIIATLLGCGSSTNFSTAKVTGRVLCNGKPVSGGAVFFSPLAQGDSAVVGKAATGDVKEDGTFVLSTYGDEDGAVIGRHSVSYAPPIAAGPDGVPLARQPKTPCSNASPIELEVKPGDNELEVPLTTL